MTDSEYPDVKMSYFIIDFGISSGLALVKKASGPDQITYQFFEILVFCA